MPLRIDPSPPTTSGLDECLRSWPFAPHRWTRSEVGLHELLVSRVQRTIAEPGSTTWTAYRDGEVHGILVLTPLGWDSRILQMSAARVELFVPGPYRTARDTADALLDAAISRAGEQGIRHISARVDAADAPSIHALESCAFINVDALVTFAASTADVPAPAAVEEVAIRPADASDAPRVGELAASTFSGGRFHADPAIPADRAEAIYREWGAASCGGPAADATLVAESRDQGDLVGFISCRLLRDTAAYLRTSIGTIPLVATSGRARGRGVGQLLVSSAAAWLRTHAAAAVEVGTQLRNVPAGRLYESCGFRLAAGSLSFRRTIDT